MSIPHFLARCVALTLAVLVGLIAAASERASVDGGYLQSLASGAGVVVTVFGIWIAIIFPRLSQSIEVGADRRNLPENLRYRRLLASLARASVVLIGSLFLVVVLPFSNDSSSLLRFLVAVFGVLCVISLGESLLLAIVDGEGAVSDELQTKARAGFFRRRNRRL